jgi:hypothetical protein
VVIDLIQRDLAVAVGVDLLKDPRALFHCQRLASLQKCSVQLLQVNKPATVEVEVAKQPLELVVCRRRWLTVLNHATRLAQVAQLPD